MDRQTGLGKAQHTDTSHNGFGFAEVKEKFEYIILYENKTIAGYICTIASIVL